MTLSIRPYSRASWAVMKLSRSQSAVTCSTLLPVFSARMRFIRLLTTSRRFRWRAMSVICPWVPAEGWWIMISALGRARRLPLVPAARRKAPMLAARPMQMVDTSHFTYCMVS